MSKKTKDAKNVHDTTDRRQRMAVNRPNIRGWKQQALDSALKALTTAASGAYERPIGIVQLDEADREFLRALALPAEDEKPRMQLNIAPFYRHKKSAETIMDPCAGKTIIASA